MHRTRRLSLSRDVLRHLTAKDLAYAVGGARPTIAIGCALRAIQGATSNADGAGPCPGEYSWTCPTG